MLGILAAFMAIAACDNPLEPEEITRLNIDQIVATPEYAEGLLSYGYAQIPVWNYKFDETGTDDAVSNNPSDNYRKMATGGWSSLSNAEDAWTACFRGIMNLNRFLSVVNDVPWRPSTPDMHAALINRLTGEAYGVRGVLKYYLIRNHGGIGTDGNLLGIPEYNTFIESLDEFKAPRESFAESIQSAKEDLDKAIQMLPEDYGDVTEVPAKFSNLDQTIYNLVYGSEKRQKFSGRVAKAFLARLDLLAASPAFNQGNDASLWETAAKSNGDLLKEIGGIEGLDPKGNQFWIKAQVDNANISSGDKTDIPEMLWRRPLSNINTWEGNNFPPTLYGSGRINPTQNLVDAFPMKNGYPITSAESGYDNTNPYANRDPRLALAVIYNGSSYKSTTITTLNGTDDNSIGNSDYSTRTGYYLKKLLREDVNMTTGKTTTQYHIISMVRYTEIFLNYAEAANEAWGPDGKGDYGFSARDVIAAIRKRAGITQPDAYLSTISSKEQMRDLIRNERRLELCFEGFRFWDMRRWNLKLDEPARGAVLTDGVYSSVEVEERAYDDHMHYGPIPFSEVLKFNFVQNQGW